MQDLTSEVKKSRVDILKKVNEQLRLDYLNTYVGSRSVMLAEVKKDYWEGYSFEYIRCYSDEQLQQGVRYNIEFVEQYLDGMKVKVLKEI